MLPQTDSTTPLSTAKKNRLIPVVILILAALFIIFAVFGIIFFRQKYFQLNPQADSTTNTITSPISIDNPGIKSYGLFYFFEGTIEKIDNTSDGLKITLDIPQKDMPEFIVADPGTKVVMFKDSTYRVTSPDALKTGQKVTIGVSYYNNLNRWLTQSVAIEVAELPLEDSIAP